MEREGMDRFLFFEKSLTETHSLTIDKNTQKTRPAAYPIRNPKDSIFSSHPLYSIKKCDRNITGEVKTGGYYQQRTRKLIPKKPGNRFERVGEFTCYEAVDILMAIKTKGELNVNKIKKRGDYQQGTQKLMPNESAINCLGEFTLMGAVYILMAIKTGGKLNETKKDGLWWEGHRRYFQSYFQKRTADPRV